MRINGEIKTSLTRVTKLISGIKYPFIPTKEAELLSGFGDISFDATSRIF